MYILKNSSQLTLRELDILWFVTIGQYAKCSRAVGMHGKVVIQVSRTEVLFPLLKNAQKNAASSCSSFSL